MSSGCQGRGNCGCKAEPHVDFVSYFMETDISGLMSEAQVGRLFDSGAYRDGEEGKLDYEGFFSPAVLERRAQYMDAHRVQSNGELRGSDNWQLGIPTDQYMKSAFRHFMDWWSMHRDLFEPGDGTITERLEEMEEAICALMFNAEGYLFELLRKKPEDIRQGT